MPLTRCSCPLVRQPILPFSSGVCAAYVNVGFGTKNYWGYYTGTCQDPDGRPQIWTIKKYARPPQGTGDQSGRWGTWWGKFHLFEIG
jgi:hypothetical protein